MAYKGTYKLKFPKKYFGKTDKPITWRSTWERRVFVDLEDNPNVIGWASEAIAIQYRSPLDGKIHKYYPDLYVQVKEGKEVINYIVEIKPFKETVPPIRGKKRKLTFIRECNIFNVNSAKWDFARKFCEVRGIYFIIMTEHDLNKFKYSNK